MNSKAIFIYTGIVLLLFALLYVIFPFLISILIGAVFVSVVFPLFQRLIKIGVGNRLSAFIIVVVFTISFLVPFGFLVVNGIEHAVQFLQHELNISKNLNEKGNLEFSGNTLSIEGIEVYPILAKLAEQGLKLTGGFLVNVFQSFVKALPFVSFSILIGLFTMYFGLIEGERLREIVIKYSLLSKVRSKKILSAIHDSCNSVIVANLIGGFIQAILVLIMALSTSLKGAILLSFATFMLSFVPVIGTAPITIGICIYFLRQEEVFYFFIWMFGGILIGFSDNIVKAWVLKGRSQLHPYLGLLSVVGGLMTMGVPGLIIGPLVATIFNSVIPIFFEARDSI